MNKQATLGLNLSVKRTRKRQFLDEMERVVPWQALVELIKLYAPQGKRGRRPFAVQTMLRIYFMQQWFGLSDPAMKEALHDVPLYRQFAGLDHWHTHLPDESTILRFRHLLEQHKLAQQMFEQVNALLTAKGLLLKAGTAVDATLIAAPSSTENKTKNKSRDPEMHSSQKAGNWYFGMKAHIGVDADSGLVHSLRGTAGNVHDIVEANTLLHAEETDAFGDSAFQGADKRPDAKPALRWHVAMKRSQRQALNPEQPIEALKEQIERIKAQIRAKVEHPFRVLKCQFGYRKVRYRGLIEEHGADRDAAGAGQFVDGEKEAHGLSAPEMGQKGPPGSKKTSKRAGQYRSSANCPPISRSIAKHNCGGIVQRFLNLSGSTARVP